MRFWLSCAVVFAVSTGLRAAPRPNIVFILADDLGWTDLRCQGSGFYDTPSIDRLAAEGMRFTHAYSAGPNCQPTRAALMSGQYGPRTGVYTVGGTDRFDTSMRPLVPVENVQRLDPAVVTVGEALRAAGYRTGYFGKWHLGDDAAHHPAAQGFEDALTSIGRHFNFRTTPPTNIPPQTYLADFLTDCAVAFIERHRSEPFFLVLAHFAVHSPYEAKADLKERFRGRPPAGGHSDPTYAAMILSLDDSVGRVIATLDRLNLSTNTLVLFSSDNGGVGGYEREGLGKTSITDNAPLRHGKGSLYEGGVRVPFIARWPGRVRAGAVCDTPVISMDLYPTFCSLSGAPRPETQPLDGVDISPLFFGGSIPERPLFWHFPGYLGAGPNLWRTTPVGAIREGPWKLLEWFEDDRIELYHLERDPGQTRNLADAEPEVARRLRERLVAWRREIHAPMPEPREPQAAAPRERANRQRQRPRLEKRRAVP